MRQGAGRLGNDGEGPESELLPGLLGFLRQMDAAITSNEFLAVRPEPVRTLAEQTRVYPATSLRPPKPPA